MEELKGYSRYFRFTTAEYNLRNVPGTTQQWAIDLELQAEYRHEARYRAYQKDLFALLSYDRQYDNSTPLDLLEQARSLKHHYFPEWWQQRVQASYQVSSQSSRFSPGISHNNSGIPGRGWLEQIKTNALFPESQGRVTLHKPAHWQYIFEQADHIIFLPDERQAFPDDLQTWLLPFFETHRLSIYAKADESPYSVSADFVTFWLQQLKLPASSITIITDPDSSPGICSLEILENAYTQESCLVAKGVWNYFSLFKSDISFLFSITNQEDLGRGLLQCAYSQEQSESLKALVGYQARPFPDAVSLTGQDFCALSLEAFLDEQKPKSVTEFFHQREHAVSIPPQWGQHYSGFFRMTPSKQVKQVALPGENHAYLQGICFDPKDFMIIPRRFHHLIDPAILSVEQAGFLTNFSYFFTENLRQAYNRRVPETEAIPTADFPFDYMLETRQGAFYETVPLYRKGYLGSRRDGSLFIGYLSVRQITCTIGKHKFILTDDAINPGLQPDFTLDENFLMQTDSPLWLFTPSYPRQRVGQGRINLVAINDRLLHVSLGQAVAIPPVGVVLSFAPEFLRQKFGQTDLPETIFWKVEFYEDDVLQKSELRWLYGGYNLLVLNGENLVTTPRQQEQTFRQEGWYLPQSMETQETQLQGDERHPRLVLGTTEQGKIFLLTISGRTRLSCGANHGESVLYSQYFVQSTGDHLRHLINLDGGASVFLEVMDKGQRQVLNFPAPSHLNPAGVIRPNSALFYIVRQ